MEYVQYIFDGLIVVATFLGGLIYTRQDKINDRLDEIPNTFARREDLTRVTDQILSSLQRIEDRMDKKADKNYTNV